MSWNQHKREGRDPFGFFIISYTQFHCLLLCAVWGNKGVFLFFSAELGVSGRINSPADRFSRWVFGLWPPEVDSLLVLITEMSSCLSMLMTLLV